MDRGFKLGRCLRFSAMAQVAPPPRSFVSCSRSVDSRRHWGPVLYACGMSRATIWLHHGSKHKPVAI